MEQETLEWLAVLRHHGTPPRLLDWRYSPTVAAYFVLRERPRTGHCLNGGGACLWAFNLGMLRGFVMDRVRTRDWGKADQKALRRVRKHKGPAYVAPFLPQNRYSWMSGQQGLFLVKTVAKVPFMATLHDMCSLDDDNFIQRFIIPHSQRIPLLAHLLCWHSPLERVVAMPDFGRRWPGTGVPAIHPSWSPSLTPPVPGIRERASETQ